jgi:hypothetical protein
MHSKVGLYRVKIFNPLDSSQRLRGTDDHILEWSSALDTSVIDNWKINNPTFDVVNAVNQDFSLKYSNNKMGINDVINKLSINNTHANLLH